MMRFLFTVVWLLFVWISLTGSSSVANVLAGGMTAIALLSFFRPASVGHGRAALRPWHAVRFFVYFNLKFVLANVQVALAVIWPERVRRRRAIIAVPIAAPTELTTMLLANAISLTPGTFIIEMGHDPPVMYVHVLQLESVKAARLDILDLERRIVRAFGPPGATDRVDECVARVRADLEE